MLLEWFFLVWMNGGQFEMGPFLSLVECERVRAAAKDYYRDQEDVVLPPCYVKKHKKFA